MPPDPTPPAWVERLQTIARPIVGDRRVVMVRAVFDRFNAAGGGLIAAGIAYNTLFALVPMLLFGGGVLGFLVTDLESQANVKDALVGWIPQLSGVVDEMLRGLSEASPSVSVIALIGVVWGATRLFASLEEGMAAIFAGAPQRSLVIRTVRRFASIAVIGGVVAGAFVATSVASFTAELVPGALDAAAVVLNLALLALPVVLTTLAVLVVYRFVPPVAPGVGSLLVPAVVVAVVLVGLTRLLAVVAPRVLGANFVYGTLGAIFVALGWLGLAYTVLLLGAAWVRERMLADEGPAPIA